MISAHDVMTEDPTTIPLTATVREAVRLLESLEVRHLPVVDEEGSLVGMLSDRDLRGLSFPEVIGTQYVGMIQSTLDAPVSSIMSSNVVCVDLEDDVSVIIELMLDHKIGAVPVIDSDDTLVGIVSYVDLLREMPFEGPVSRDRGTTIPSRRN